MSGHGGSPGKFEPCRRFEVGFHNTFLVHPGTKTAACLHGESYNEIRILIPGSSCKRMCVYVYGLSWTQPGTSFIPGWNPPCKLTLRTKSCSHDYRIMARESTANNYLCSAHSCNNGHVTNVPSRICALQLCKCNRFKSLQKDDCHTFPNPSSLISKSKIKENKSDPDVIRTRNLLIWSQTRYRCATESAENY